MKDEPCNPACVLKQHNYINSYLACITESVYIIMAVDLIFFFSV